MKEITAFIRINKMNETRNALVAAGFSGFTVRKVQGRGKGPVSGSVLKGAAEGKEEAIALLGGGPPLSPKRMISMVVPDAKAKDAITALIAANKTGNPGDGKIFINEVTGAFRIRTNESGDAALSES